MHRTCPFRIPPRSRGRNPRAKATVCILNILNNDSDDWLVCSDDTSHLHAARLAFHGPEKKFSLKIV